jgi:hypothetical protein
MLFVDNGLEIMEAGFIGRGGDRIHPLAGKIQARGGRFFCH